MKPRNGQSPALLVKCPICGRGLGEICADPRGNGLWGRPHRARLRAALALLFSKELD